MKVGIIGLGSMGKRRLRLIQSNFKGIILCGIDTDKNRQEEVQNIYKIPTYDSLEKAKNQFNLDAVFVCTSPISHESIILEALSLNCDVFTEINLLNNYYSEAIKLANEKNKFLYLSSTFLKRKEIQYIQSKVNNRVDISYRYHVGQYLPDWHPWEDYRNFFVANKSTNGCREIFAIELPWIVKTFGKIKSFSVKSRKISTLDIDYPDNYNLLIEHENGVTGTLTVDIVSRVAKRELTVIGEKILLEWGGNPETLFDWSIEDSKMIKIELYDQINHDSNYSHTIIEDAYLDEIKEFFDVREKNGTFEYGFDQDNYVIDLINEIEDF
ncbi:Gfo/Idh/MocA family oxidoreductase [Enterococcus devriesei]|uniref:Gfo/Idh/MocA family protein n=1 Tax=Enterococcus devriesei TaxID=319970 RepID=UPI002891B2BA|nr:Gfo/Idh/MocA family oxidoreductase [Enterococcus devriesei]MDT2820808.1 Gfo/Idh/MocA family oxidoreductase [Enterococcus devriesei]